MRLLSGRWLAGLVGLFAFGAGPAHAAMDQTWIAVEGSDAASCTSLDPCASLAKAASVTAPSGTIFVMDSGFYGPVTLTQAVSIRSEMGRPVMIAQITINAGPADKFTIADVDLEGTATVAGIAYPYGIKINGALELLVQNCGIRYYMSGDATAISINSAYQVRVTLDKTTVYANQIGVLVTDNGGTGHLKLFNSLLMANYTAGVRVVNAGNDVIMVGNNILGSTKALDLQNGGVGKSYGGNTLTSGDIPSSLATY
ncbi:MAG TPA: right-handed parallel beta-helix repeat-containing protein [Novosphingobium sp.]|nr:right-handed parallel beta-helix repeat-containing protein [Novosphingobium sp.]